MKISKFAKRIFFLFILIISLLSLVPSVNALNENILLAGGCFWCLEHDLEDLPGVLNVESGYTGGDMINPNYRNHEGHQEAVKVTFDPSKMNLQDILGSYWHNIDPFDSTGQFCDRGNSYRPVIFYDGNHQKELAIESMEKAARYLSVSLDEIGVEIKPANEFWLAEEYHQDFAKKNPAKYKFYRFSCQRDNRLKEVWRE